MIDDKQKVISNKANYRKSITNYNIVILEYIKVLHQYLIHITKNTIIEDKTNYYYIVSRGYDLLKNVFLNLILYTKNLDLSLYHLKKSYLYYTEFIGQIGEDSNSYLQLNSKDACLFVYKKTIYDINDEYRKKFKMPAFEEYKNDVFQRKLLIINRIEKILVYKHIFQDDNVFLLEEQRENYVKNIRISIVKILEHLNDVIILDNKENKEHVCELFDKVDMFLNFIDIKKEKMYINQIKDLTTIFIKKIVRCHLENKKGIKKETLHQMNLLFDEKMSNLTTMKFLNKLFRN